MQTIKSNGDDWIYAVMHSAANWVSVFFYPKQNSEET